MRQRPTLGNLQLEAMRQERQLHRKDKALAETAALLVLSKKLAAVFHDGEDV